MIVVHPGLVLRVPGLLGLGGMAPRERTRHVDLTALLFATAARAGSPPRLRILIVDDETELASVIARALKRTLAATRNVQLETAPSPEAALAILRAGHDPAVPLVVVSDYNLRADRDGIQLLEEIRALQPDARRVLMSGYDRQEFEARLPAARLDAVLSKPLDLTGLGRLIGSLVDGDRPAAP